MGSVMGSVIELAVGGGFNPCLEKFWSRKLSAEYFCVFFWGGEISDNFQNKAGGQSLFGKTQNSSKFVGLFDIIMCLTKCTKPVLPCQLSIGVLWLCVRYISQRDNRNQPPSYSSYFIQKFHILDMFPLQHQHCVGLDVDVTAVSSWHCHVFFVGVTAVSLCFCVCSLQLRTTWNKATSLLLQQPRSINRD